MVPKSLTRFFKVQEIPNCGSRHLCAVIASLLFGNFHDPRFVLSPCQRSEEGTHLTASSSRRYLTPSLEDSVSACKWTNWQTREPVRKYSRQLTVDINTAFFYPSVIIVIINNIKFIWHSARVCVISVFALRRALWFMLSQQPQPHVLLLCGTSHCLDFICKHSHACDTSQNKKKNCDDLQNDLHLKKKKKKYSSTVNLVPCTWDRKKPRIWFRNFALMNEDWERLWKDY